MAKTSGLFHSVPSGVTNTKRGGSAPQNTAVGSGSRPDRSKHGTESSAPSDPKFIRGNVKNPLS